MKTTMTKERNSVLHSTSIERFRNAQVKTRGIQKNELPAEIENYDVGWKSVILGSLAFFGIGVFFLALLGVVLIFGAQF